ncbi:hypothetical protein FB45DRAFT_724381, partial [Roridomyces roridus]
SLLHLTPASYALVGISWSMSGVPTAGLPDITFPLTIVTADHISGYYFAQQFGFVETNNPGATQIGYTGLQPRPDNNGQTVLHAVFSSFVPGSTTTDAGFCTSGADGGAGVSCSVEWNGVYGRMYLMEVKNAGNTTWVGTVIDTVTGQRVHITRTYLLIGTYKLPTNYGGIASSQVGFVEWYPWNAGEPANHCALLPYQKTIFGVPTTTHPGAVGTEDLAYEYGDCVGEVDFQTVSAGTQADCGF